MEYLHHFELSDDPFRNDHVERFLVEVPSQTDVLRRLDRGVRQGRGLVALVGPPGSGKSVVARRLFEELEEEVFEAAMMVVLRSQADSEWLLYRFAGQLGVEDPAGQREALVEQIYERLAIVREDGRRAVLIIDDADALARHETLTELCALVKLEYEERRMLTVVLVGSGPLDRALRATPELAHRVEVRVAMQPLPPEEVSAYLGHRLSVAGGDPQLLLPGAAVALHELANGAPGLMNILADNALFTACASGRQQVARSDVERAYADLGWGSVGGEAPEPPAGPRAHGGRPADHPVSSGESAAGRPASGHSAAGRPEPVVETTEPDIAVPEADLDSDDELDSELEAVFSPLSNGGGAEAGPRTVLMDFDAAPARAKRPAPSRAAAAPTEIQLGPADVVREAPPKDEDAVDELFMELIDE